MDSNSTKVVMDVSKSKEPISDVSVVPSSSSASSVPCAKDEQNQALVSGRNPIKKHIIRKIIPIDPKKLQQSGLDRKIAEVLSKQKSQQSNKSLKVNVSALPSTSTIQGAKSPAVSNIVQKQFPDKNHCILTQRKPPKITVTGPEALTEQEKQSLANLNSQQRLAMSKFPHQKLPTKPPNQKPVPTNRYIVLKEPVVPTLGDQQNIKLPTSTSAKKIPHVSEKTIEQSAKSAKPKTPPKSPQDVARKLLFQTKLANEVSHPDDEEFLNCLNKDVDEIPKASIKMVNIQQQYIQPKQDKKLQQVGGQLSRKQCHSVVNKSQGKQNFQAVYMKQQKVQKPLIKTVKTQVQEHCLPHSSKNKCELKLDFTEVSPLKEPFPTVNVPKETPLPAIDSFKKPYPMVIGSPTDYTHPNYETSIFNQEATASHQILNLKRTGMVQNSLVVLENKILSQDEMIDLTELRLSTSAHRFIHPHRPIPELVIKQESPDEYIASDIPATVATSTHTSVTDNCPITMPECVTTQEIQIKNCGMPSEKLAISKKQNRKIIINAQKLKLPPEKLAELARKIKQTTTASSPPKKDTRHSKKKTEAIQTLCTNIGNKISPVKNTAYVPPNQSEMISKEMTDNLILPTTRMYNLMYNQDHNYFDDSNVFIPRQFDINASLIEKDNQSSSDNSKIYNYYDNSQQVLIENSVNTADTFKISDNSKRSMDYSNSAVEIVNEPVETENCFSAIDFIAALGNTSLELSPEEHNLNASCSLNALNQSYSPMKNDTSPQKSTKTNMETNPNKNLLKGTIVIESSYGQETILTNENSDKCDLEIPDKLQTLKVYHNKVSPKLNMQKPAKNLLEHRHLTKCENQSYTDIQQTDYSQPVKTPVYNLDDPKLFDNTEMCDMDIEDSSEAFVTKANSQKQEDLVKFSENVKLTDNISVIEESLQSSNALYHNKTQPVLESLSKSSAIIDLTHEKEANHYNEPTTTTALNSKAEDLLVLEKTKNEINNKSFVFEKFCTQPAIQNAETITHDTQIRPSQSSNDLSSTNVSTAMVLQQEIEVLKPNESNAKPGATSKRISKFKKGKINLVQRNRTLQTNSKTEVNKSFNHISNNDEPLTERQDEQTTTYSNREGEESQNVIALGNTTFTTTSQSNNTTNKENAEQIKATEAIDKEMLNLSPRLQKNKPELMPPLKETLTKEKHTINLNNLPTIANAESAKKNFGNYSLKDVTDIPKATIASSPSSSIRESKQFMPNIKSFHILKEPSGVLTDQNTKETEPEETELAINSPANEITKEAPLLTTNVDEIQNTKRSAILADSLVPKQEILLPKIISFSSEKTVKNIQPLKKNIDTTKAFSEESICKTSNPQTDEPIEHCLKVNPEPEDLQSNIGNANSCRSKINLVKFSETLENFNDKTYAILQTMKCARVSLIDIVKYSPIKPTNSSPLIPFKKSIDAISKTSPEVKGITTLLNQLKTSNKEKEQTLDQSEKPMEKMTSCKSTCSGAEETKKNTTKAEQRAKNKERTSRSESRTSDSLIDTQLPAAITRKRLSTRPLISDDDLEFLPENAEVKFQLSKLKRTERNKQCEAKISFTPTTRNKRQSLYANPMELELFNSPSSHTKRTRYYSQTLETNVTITFDNLKSKAKLNKNAPNLETEDSCHDTTQDSNFTTPIKQRKKLRKTIEDIKKSQKSHSDTDSEEDQRDYDCPIRDYEGSNEFLGFEETTESCSFKNNEDGAREMEHDSKTNHGVLRNWLYTGKAISPTFEKEVSKKRVRRRNKDLPASSVILDIKEQVPLKKRKNICSNTYEETDITDDTSPADDEEEISEQIPICQKIKSGIKNVISSNKNSTVSKDMKLDEHSFAKPSSKVNNSGTDSDCCEEKPEKSPKSQFNKKNLLESLSETTNSLDVATYSGCNDENTGKSKRSVKKARKEHARFSKNLEHKDSTDKSETVSEISDTIQSQVIKSEEVKTRQTRENYSENSNIDCSLRAKTNSERLDAKSKRENIKQGKETKSKICEAPTSKIPATDSDNLKDDTTNLGMSKKQTDDIDKNLGCSKTKSRRSKTKEKTSDDNINENPNVLQQPEEPKDRGGNETSSRLESRSEAPKTHGNETDEINVNENANLQIAKGVDGAKNLEKKPTITKAKEKSTTDELSTQMDSSKKRNLRMLHKRKLNTEYSDSDGLPTPLNANLNISPKQKLEIEDSSSDSLLIPLSKTKKTEGPISDSNSTTKKGRRQREYTESNFNHRLLLITKREQLDKDEIMNETKPVPGTVQCGLCLNRTQPSKWATHLAEHYGVGWKVGEEKLHVDNRTAVFNAISSYLKSYNTAGLACRMCKKVLRSSLGIITHLETCGAEVVRVECEFCKKDYTKSSLAIHIRTCRSRIVFEKQGCIGNQAENTEEIVGNSGRLKRHSTIKAENKLKALGEELEKITDTKKPKVDPKLHIRYVPPVKEDFSAKWSKDIDDVGQASCPKTRCKFNSKDLKQLSEHVKNCQYLKSGYICNFCRKVFESENEAIEHVIKDHNRGRSRKKSGDSDCGLKTDGESSSDDDELSEGVDENDSADNLTTGENDFDIADEFSPSKRSNRKPIRFPQMFQSRKNVFVARSLDLNKDVLNKWKNFLQLNYSCELLYNEFKPQYDIANRKEYDKYLPSQNVSMKFHFKTTSTLNKTVGLPEKDIEWSELKRYETISMKSNTYFFLGAPVKFCSWLPLPAHVEEQYLAVVYRQDMFKFIKFSQPKKHHSVVLLFKVTQNKKVPALSMHYGFLVKDGPIHCLSFLPSGGYDESSNRLGLVAIGTVTSCIKVLSLPLNVDLADTEENCSSREDIILIDLKPIFLLNLDVLYQQEKEKQEHTLLNPQCLQLCWSEYSGHQHIFAGFSNGFIGIWNITNDPLQNLNRFLIDNIISFTPVNYFYAGEKSIKCLAVHYDTSGPRWLAASTAYRKLIIYDVKSFVQPIILKEEVHKNVLLSLDWCPIWETFLYSYDDTLQNAGNGICVVSPNNIVFTQNKLEVLISGVTQVHYTPVTNMCASAFTNGEILLHDTKELHYDYCVNKKIYEKRALYAMDVKKLDEQPLTRLPKATKKNENAETPSDWLMNDYNYKEKYGLVFSPLLKLTDKEKKTYLSEDRLPPPNMLPFMRINTLRCNINQKGKNLIAAGYENGFLRLVYFCKENTFSS